MITAATPLAEVAAILASPELSAELIADVARRQKPLDVQLAIIAKFLNTPSSELARDYCTDPEVLDDVKAMIATLAARLHNGQNEATS